MFHPETDSVDPGGSEESLLGRRRSTPETGRHRHSEGRLPALPSAGQRARKEALREIDEVSKKLNNYNMSSFTFGAVPILITTRLRGVLSSRG